MKPPVQPRPGVLVGMYRVAIGRASFVACFGNSAQSFLSSLAPLLAFPLAGAALGLFTEGPERALTGLAMALCATLTPAVLSFELARLWKRSDHWLRFATAFNWCEWLLPIAGFLLMVPVSLAIGLGVDKTVASEALLGCLGLYGLWLQWFLAREALALPTLKAMILVILMNVGTVVAVFGPVFAVRAFWPAQ